MGRGVPGDASDGGAEAGRAAQRRLPPGPRASDSPDGLSMAVRIVRLGSARTRGEGVRIGTVRHPPRGVRKDQLAARDWYDVWLPDLAPSRELVRSARAADSPRRWAAFVKRYRSEMVAPGTTRLLRLLAALSRGSDFSVGCYCADETRCHRSVLRALLEEHGAKLA